MKSFSFSLLALNICLFLSFNIKAEENLIETPAEMPHRLTQILPLIQKNCASKLPEMLYESAHIYFSKDFPENCSKLDTMDEERFNTLQSVHLFDQVIPTIDHTHTAHGHIALALQLTQLKHNLSELEQYKNNTIAFQHDSKLIDKIDRLLKSLDQSEIIFITEYAKETLQKQASEALLNAIKNAQKDFHTNNQPESKSIFDTPTIQTTKEKIKAAWSPIGKTISAIFRNQYVAEIQTRFEQLSGPALLYYAYTQNEIRKKSINTYEQTKCIEQSINGAYLGLCAAYRTKANLDQDYAKQKSLIQINHMLQVVKKINSLSKGKASTVHIQQEIASLNKLANYNKGKAVSSDLKAFLAMLDSPTFTGEAVYGLARTGKIHETYSRFLEIKHELIPYWEALGSIDAKIATIKLLNNEDKEQAQFCIPSFIDHATPKVIAQKYWHPAIDSNIVVTNNMIIGDNHPNNIIITGANAGGKTTCLTAIMLSIILSQTIGIAPAATFTFTPFAKLQTYLDISTNLTDNESLFVAQANRAKKLYDSVTSCSNNEKCFSILDEIFTGTRADYAEQASVDYAAKLGAVSNNCMLLATHFPKLTTLEKTSSPFTNYKVADAHIQDDGSIDYPYKIVPGISTQNIANHILKQKNIL